MLFTIKLEHSIIPSYVFLIKYFHSYLFNAAVVKKKKRVRIKNKVTCIDILRVVFEKFMNWLVISIIWAAIKPDKLLNGVIINKQPKQIMKIGKERILIEKNGRFLNLINL